MAFREDTASTLMNTRFRELENVKLVKHVNRYQAHNTDNVYPIWILLGNTALIKVNVEPVKHAPSTVNPMDNAN